MFSALGSAVKSFTGKDSYQFGDITRTVFKKVIGGLDDVYRSWTPPEGRDADYVYGAPLLGKAHAGAGHRAGGYYGALEEGVDSPATLLAGREGPMPSAGGDDAKRSGSDTSAAATGGAGGAAGHPTVPRIPPPPSAGSGARGGAGGWADAGWGDEFEVDGAATGGAAGARASAGAAAAAPVVDAGPAEEAPAFDLTPVSMRDLWGSFFTSSLRVGTGAVAAGLVSADDIECREAFVYIGLPALTLLEALLRSVGARAPGIMLSHGLVVQPETCPEDVADMFTELYACKTAVQDMGFAVGAGPAASNEARYLRATCLYASSDREVPAAIASTLSDETKLALRRHASTVQGLAIRVTQLSFFKSNFEAVLEDLDEAVASTAGS